ncbi:MAG: U32 family peptidase [Syntrophomonadaceae bacterium]
MELLAPAGNWEALLAAVNNGADAVYLGGTRFSARQAAANFDRRQMEEAVAYAHCHGRKVYVTVNTLIDNREFEPGLDYLFELANLGVDAVILQDMGLLQAATSLLPGLPIHASTQMTTHNQAGAAFLHSQGVTRIVLARELSAGEIKIIRAAVPGVELEVFVHGALCYCYSGQCLMSSLIGGRSGNRGRCAQPCRLPYRLYRHDQPVAPGGRGKYWLSQADLCLIDYLPVLARAGVSALKIEGRMRRPEYVAVVTQVYRQVLDHLQEEPDYKPSPAIKERLLRIFNRNFTRGYIADDGDELMSLESPKNRGVPVGRVVEQNQSGLTKIRLDDTVRRGDGLAVWTSPQQTRGVLLREIKTGGTKVAEAGAGQVIEIKLEGPVSPSDMVYKTHDEGLLAEARLTISRRPAPRIPVDAQVIMAPGQRLRLVFEAQGRRVTACTDHGLESAAKQPLSSVVLRQKISRLGDSPFILRNLTVTGEEENLTVPFSDINEARRQAAALLQAKLQPQAAARADQMEFEKRRRSFLAMAPPAPAGPYRTRLAVAVSSPEMVSQALSNGADLVYLGIDGLGTHQRLDSKRLSQFRAGLGGDAGRVVPVLPHIRKPAQQFDYHAQVGADFPRVMVSNWADLTWARDKAFFIHTDYNMNVFNSYTLRFLAGQGAGCVCLSPELNIKQLTAFNGLSQAELLVHGELILMQSQYCLIGRTRAPGLPACGLPCRSGDYSLHDDRGYVFPLETDSDCRQYIFNSRVLCLMEDLDRILALHPASIRIEARRTDMEGLGLLVRLYREAADQIAAGRRPELSAYQGRLAEMSEVAFTKGHYYRGVL